MGPGKPFYRCQPSPFYRPSFTGDKETRTKERIPKIRPLDVKFYISIQIVHFSSGWQCHLSALSNANRHPELPRELPASVGLREALVHGLVRSPRWPFVLMDVLREVKWPLRRTRHLGQLWNSRTFGFFNLCWLLRWPSRPLQSVDGISIQLPLSDMMRRDACNVGNVGRWMLLISC